MTTESDEVHLRRIALSDADRIHEWAKDPEASRYQPWGPNTHADTVAFVADAVRGWTVRPQQRWAWVAANPSDLVVRRGEVHLRGHGRAEISYSVHIDLWGQGIGSAIGHQLTRWAFENLPELERLEGTCDPRNTASASSVLRRIGMTYEDTLRHVRLIRDGWRDSHIFSILRNEWTGGQPVNGEA